MSALAAIHVAKRDLGLDEETYRDLLERVTGKRSAGDMDEAERGAVLEEFRRLGFERSSKPGQRRLDGPFAGKLQALWIAGWNLGVVRKRDDAALLAFVERQTGISHTRFLRDAGDARKAIEALKAWLAREAQVDWSASTYDGDDRFKIVSAQLRRLGQGPNVCWQIARKGFAEYESADWIEVMNALGRKLRAGLSRKARAA